MSGSHLEFTALIVGSPEIIFDLIADMPNYSRWLPDSDAFGGTVDVTPYPVRLGTTYLDAGPIEKPGTVTEFDPPRHISFQHTVLIRRGPLRTDIDARIRYTIEPKQGGTFVLRELDLTMNLRGLFKLGDPGEGDRIGDRRTACRFEPYRSRVARWRDTQEGEPLRARLKMFCCPVPGESAL